MGKKFLGITLLCFLLFISVSSAKDYEVSVGVTPNIISINPFHIANFDVNIENRGELNDTYSISIDGINEDWYILSQDSVTLESGESEKVYLFITPDSYEREAFKGSLMVTGNSNDTDIFFLNVVPDHEIKITSPKETKTCLQESEIVNITLKNEGNYTEELVLEASGNASDFVELTENELTLGPEESGELALKVTPTELGMYSLELEASSKGSYAKASTSSLINVVECYNVVFDYPEKAETCLNEEIKIEISLENTGLKEDSYEIKYLNMTKIIELKPGEKETLEIGLLGEEVGSYDTEFNIESEHVKKEGVVEFTVLKCYDVDISVEEKEFDIELGRGKLVKVKVENLGTKEDEFEIISDVDWVSIKPSFVSLDENESEDVYVYYSPKFGMEGKFNASLKAKSNNSEDIEKLKISVSEVTEPSLETTTTTIPSIEIPTGGFGEILEDIMGNRVLRSLLISIIVVIIILIAIYLVVMR